MRACSKQRKKSCKRSKGCHWMVGSGCVSRGGIRRPSPPARSADEKPTASHPVLGEWGKGVGWKTQNDVERIDYLLFSKRKRRDVKVATVAH